MKFKIAIFFFLLTIVCLKYTAAKSSYSHTEDSLLQVISEENNSKKKLNNYWNLIQFSQKNDLEKSVKYCNLAIEYCKQQNDLKTEIEYQIEKCKALIWLGKYDDSSISLLYIEQQIKTLNDDILWGKLHLLKNLAFINVSEFAKAMENAKLAVYYFQKTGFTLGLAKTYSNIGSIYDLTNDNQKALDYYLLAMEQANIINNQDIIANLFNSMGIIYDKLNDKHKALEYYYKALEYNTASGNVGSSSLQLNNIATIFVSQKRYGEALAYYKKALTLNKTNKNKNNEALILSNLSDVFIETNQYDSAQLCIQKALAIYKSSNDFYNEAHMYNALGTLFIKQAFWDQAIRMLDTSIQLAKKTEVLNLQESGYKLLSEIHEHKKNYKLAYDLQKIAYLISDSIKIQGKLDELKYSDFKIEFQKLSGKFENDLKHTSAIYQSELDQERQEKYTYVLLLIVIIFISIIFYRNSKRSKKINKTLVLKNREVEDQKELIEISNIELREQYSFTETLLNTIPNPVFYTDKSNLLLGCNKAFEDITGIAASDVIGLKTSQINIDFDQMCASSKIKDANKKEMFKNEGILKFADGLKHDVICYRKGIVDSDDKLIGILGIIIDITDIRDAEKKLKFSQNRLKDAINAKDKFFNIMAHDLKNPFNAILGLTSFIADDFDAHTEDELKEYIGLVNQSSTKIYNLLENLLEWARAQSGSLEKKPETFVLNETIQECITLFSHTCEQKKIRLKADLNKAFEVNADKNMIMTVLRNLIGNAIKFTPHGGIINIIATDKNHEISVSVIDSGVGIPLKNIERLFKIDQPLSTPGVDNERGTGLGLIICKEFVKQNGGAIHVTSTPNEGSNFTFTIPVN